MPIPLTSSPLTIPEIALYGDDKQTGVAKFAAVAYDAKSGALISSQDPQFGFSKSEKKTLLIFFTWRDNDVYPPSGSVLPE